MVGVLFHLTDWEQYPGTDNPQNTIKQWFQHAMAFGVDTVIMVDETTYKIGQYYKHNRSDIDFKRYESLDECIEDNETINFVFLELKDIASSLKDFQHPTDNVIYVTGPNHNSITSSYEPYEWIQIETKSDHALYDQMASVITLYDRLRKEG